MYKNYKKIRLVVIILLAVAILPMVVAAQAQDPTALIKGIFTRLEQVFFIIFDGLVILMCVYAGILYLTARGEPGKIQKANQAIIWAAVGIAVGILANSASGIVNWFLAK